MLLHSSFSRQKFGAEFAAIWSREVLGTKWAFHFYDAWTTTVSGKISIRPQKKDAKATSGIMLFPPGHPSVRGDAEFHSIFAPTLHAYIPIKKKKKFLDFIDIINV